MPLQKENIHNSPASKIPVPKRGHLQAKGENVRNSPASKIPVPKRDHPQSTGSAFVQAANSKSSKLDNAPQTDEDKMEFLRSKLENSIPAFIHARKELEEVLSAGGSSEQGRPLSDVAAELKSELQRHRALTSKVKPLLKENRLPKKLCQEKTVPPNSYEFLKSILGFLSARHLGG